MIRLTDIWEFAAPSQYKLHFARFNRKDQPLAVFARDREKWKGWQEYRPKSDAFNRQYIFSVMDFYHEPDIWLFGGIWEVTKRLPTRYEVALTNQGRGFIGRLKLRSSYRAQATRVNFENYLNEFEVSEILREAYSGIDFPGHDSIDIGFAELESLMHTNPADWRGALQNAKGVYVITDTKTGRLYVGAAYGEGGIWARWRAYSATGHGGNSALKALLKKQPDSFAYCRQHFRFALLESHTARIADDTIITRETHWKQVLQSRGKLGLNVN